VAALFGPRHTVLRIPSRARQSIKEHEAIIRAIADQDPKQASEAIRLHMASVRAVLLALQENV
jgi:DNA-binding FadR family transcriptional regulator